MVDCLNNLEQCQASCCRYITFILNFITKDLKQYLEWHGCKIIQEPNRSYRVIVPVKCNALTVENKCTLHDLDLKPKCCKDMDFGCKREYYITEGCLLK